MAKSPALIAKLKSFSDKLTGTSRVDNGNDPTSAAFKMKKALNTPKQVPFKPKPTSNGVGVGP